MTTVRNRFPDTSNIATAGWEVFPKARANAEGIFRHVVKYIPACRGQDDSVSVTEVFYRKNRGPSGPRCFRQKSEMTFIEFPALGLKGVSHTCQTVTAIYDSNVSSRVVQRV